MSKSKKIAPRVVVAAAAAAVVGTVAPSAMAVIRINEAMINGPGVNVAGSNTNQDFIELISTTPGESFSNLSLICLEGDAGAAGGVGCVDRIIPLTVSGGPTATGTNGLYLRHNFLAGKPLPAPDPATTLGPGTFGGHENTAITWVVVADLDPAVFPSKAADNTTTPPTPAVVGTDLDTNDDGTLDSTPWSSVIGAVGILDGNVLADRVYGAALGGADFNELVQGFVAPGIIDESITSIIRTPDGTFHAAQVTGAIGGPYNVAKSDTLPLNYALTPGNLNATPNNTARAFVGASGANWSAAGNWAGGVIPNGVDHIATFDGGSGATVNVDTNMTLSGIFFNGGSRTLAAGGGTITLDSSTNAVKIGLAQNSSSIAAPVVMLDDAVINVGRNWVLTLESLTGTGKTLTRSNTGRLDVKDLAVGTVVLPSGGSTLRLLSGGTSTIGNVNGASPFQAYGNATIGGIDGAGATTIGDATANVVNSNTVTAGHIIQGNLTVSAGATAVIAPNGTTSGTSVIGTIGAGGPLTIAGGTDAWTGKLNLNNNDLIIRAVEATRAAVHDRTINQLKQGANFSQSGSFWLGSGGITTSLGGTGSGSFGAIGVLINDFALLGDPTHTGPLYTSFSGQTVGTNDVLVKYTYFGDANLDGSVTTDDYFQIDNGFLAGRSGWINGDFNYDGVIDTSDYFLIDNAFLGQGAALVPAAISGSPLSGATAVPEPASLGVLAAAAAGLLVRRGRRRE